MDISAGSLQHACGTEWLVPYGRELKVDFRDNARSNILHSFLELLLNAMEHGGRFNPTLKVDAGYLHTDGAIPH